MTIFQIECFLALYDCLNFTKAAEKLFTSQPYLSRQILALEKELDAKLFERDSHRVVPTLIADTIYTDFKIIPELVANAKAKAESANRGLTGSLEIGILDSINTNMNSMKTIKSFIGSYPNISVSINRCRLTELNNNLKNGHFDIIITTGLFVHENKDLIKTRVLDKRDLGIAINRQSKWYNENLGAISDLADIPFVIPDSVKSAYDQILDLCKTNGLIPQNIRLVSSMENMLFSVESGAAIAMIDRNTRLEYNEEIFWFSVPSGNEGSLFASWLSSNTTPALTTFLDHLSSFP